MLKVKEATCTIQPQYLVIDHCLERPFQGTHRFVFSLHLDEVVPAFFAFAVFHELFK
jgi:hypothetical protein